MTDPDHTCEDNDVVSHTLQPDSWSWLWLRNKQLMEYSVATFVEPLLELLNAKLVITKGFVFAEAVSPTMNAAHWAIMHRINLLQKATVAMMVK